MPIGESQIEENVRRPIRKRGLHQRLQDFELFWDNEINDDDDFVHFELIAKSKSIKTEEALSGQKWICYEGGVEIDWEE